MNLFYKYQWQIQAVFFIWSSSVLVKIPNSLHETFSNNCTSLLLSFSCVKASFWPALFLQGLTETLQKRLLFALAIGKRAGYLAGWDERLLDDYTADSMIPDGWCQRWSLSKYVTCKCINIVQWETRGRFWSWKRPLGFPQHDLAIYIIMET